MSLFKFIIFFQRTNELFDQNLMITVFTMCSIAYINRVHVAYVRQELSLIFTCECLRSLWMSLRIRNNWVYTYYGANWTIAIQNPNFPKQKLILTKKNLGLAEHICFCKVITLVRTIPIVSRWALEALFHWPSTIAWDRICLVSLSRESSFNHNKLNYS